MKIFISVLTIAVVVSLAGYCFAEDLRVFGYVKSFDRQKGELVVKELDINSRLTGKILIISDNDKKILSEGRQGVEIERMLKQRPDWPVSVKYRIVGDKNIIERYLFIPYDE